MAKTVMIVDDNPKFLEFASSCLKAAGYEVLQHGEGEGRGAASEAACQNPDLIMLDVSMPDVSGFSVLKHLRCNPTTRGIPVIVCTGAVEFIRQQEALLGNVKVDVLEKPFALAELLSKVQAAIGKG